MEYSTLGRTGLKVSGICVGTGLLGSQPAPYGTVTAVDTIRKVIDGPLNFIDTSNEYGSGGNSERRIGQALAEAGGCPDGFVVATKVDPVPGTKDYSGDRVRRSIDESLERLGLDQLPLVYLHDPEKIAFEEGVGPGGPLEALIDLRNQGVIRSLGVAGGPIDLEQQYLATGEFDVVISHNRYTLVDQTAEPLIRDALARGVAFINAAPFGGGMLVKGPVAAPNYCYRPASAAIIERVRRMEAICVEYSIPLAAAALQFSTRDPRVSSTIVGMSEPGRVDEILRLADVDIPEEFWHRIMPVAAAGTGELDKE
ncbi:aldo/keto reductase [Paenarthrobacter nicotinovorans]|uniref:aldo/keto reductase n=1 Tax=Paenarthrobacter nicotinovorans TaxID=29320 RepID=UPI00374A4360